MKLASYVHLALRIDCTLFISALNMAAGERPSLRVLSLEANF